MKLLRTVVIAFAIVAALPASANFTHIVVVVQENRTPDNLFWTLCQQATCDINDSSKYDILTDNWRNQATLVTPQPVDLAMDGGGTVLPMYL